MDYVQLNLAKANSLVTNVLVTKWGSEFMWSIEQLTEELLALPSLSRALLAEKLVESLEFDTDPEIQAAWTTEAKTRRDEVRDGSVQPIPGEEALAQVRRLLEQ